MPKLLFYLLRTAFLINILVFCLLRKLQPREGPCVWRCGVWGGSSMSRGHTGGEKCCRSRGVLSRSVNLQVYAVCGVLSVLWADWSQGHQEFRSGWAWKMLWCLWMQVEGWVSWLLTLLVCYCVYINLVLDICPDVKFSVASCFIYKAQILQLPIKNCSSYK